MPKVALMRAAGGHEGETARSSGLWSGSGGEEAVCGSLLSVSLSGGSIWRTEEGLFMWRRRHVRVVALTFISYAPFTPLAIS